MAMGFEVHHIDGDHANNVPGNLVLIEETDHQRLHSGEMTHRGPVRYERIRTLYGVTDKEIYGEFIRRVRLGTHFRGRF